MCFAQTSEGNICQHSEHHYHIHYHQVSSRNHKKNEWKADRNWKSHNCPRLCYLGSTQSICLHLSSGVCMRVVNTHKYFLSLTMH